MTNSKFGLRDDIGHFVRSSWEANVARYYNYLQVPYEYEKKIFYFPNVKNGAVNYKPDFYLPDRDVYIEVKGRMTSKDRTKMKRMKKFHPDVTVELLGKDEYAQLEKEYGKLIPNWEFPSKKKRDAHKEKVTKVLEILEEEGHITAQTDEEEFDVIAVGEHTRLIKVVYLDKGEQPFSGGLLLEDFDVHPNVSKEVWVFTYGKSGYEIHHY